MSLRYEFTLGCDPEVFLAAPDGKPVPSIGLIGGTKNRPLPVQFGALQEDNVTAEFNIIPAKTKAEWVHNINSVMGELKKKAKEKNLNINITDVVKFSKASLNHKQAQVSGCNEVYNAYDYAMVSPLDLTKMQVRFAGGHIHIGYHTIQTTEEFLFFTLRLLDCTIGCESLLSTNLNDRVAYGLGHLSNFRSKPYGIEYTSPSNFWLKDIANIERVWDTCEAIVELLDLIEDPKDDLTLIREGHRITSIMQLLRMLHMEGYGYLNKTMDRIRGYGGPATAEELRSISSKLRELKNVA